ncbi:hypothetical protein Slin14017_G109690 [Septoria linicola]|nr:hypothetical protein Slin14017_G109690 [Septoria linicola]
MPTEQSITSTALTRNDSTQPHPDTSSPPYTPLAVVTTISRLPENQPGFVWSNWDQDFTYHSPVEQIPSNWFLAAEYAKMQLRFAQMAALYEICYPDTKEDLERAMCELQYEMSRVVGYCRDMLALRRTTLGEGRNRVEHASRRVCAGVRRREREEMQVRDSWA